ncbi:alcohol dehydrogenase [Sphingomonas sp. DBB INV C78]|uniref:Zn-dependent alcohol dehydrogenase n=1 Tax=Sphingomonas sp. DBB INV C78 TaxID=3349434 RepID=UPI0036D2C998
MKAAVVRHPGRFEIETVVLDRPDEDEVRLRVLASGLCHTDYHVMLGRMRVPLPVVAGHEAVGIVEAVGEDVPGIRPGDLVATCASLFCGACVQCQMGRNYLCDAPPGRAEWQRRPRLRSSDGTPLYQLALLGGFAEAMLVHHRSLVKLPSDIPPTSAALLGCAVLTGFGAVTSAARVRPGSSVAVIGCGGVGLNVIQSAAICGAAQIVAVDTNPAKLELARAFGATTPVVSSPDVAAEVIALLEGGADYAFDVVGTPASLHDACSLLAKGGTAILVGAANPEEDLHLSLGSLLFREIRLIGSLMGSVPFQLAIPRLVQLYRRGALKLDELVSDVITLEEINEGYGRLAAGAATRIVIGF